MKVTLEISCPGCGSRDVRPSRRQGWLALLLNQFSIEPYRCYFCHRRFFRPGVGIQPRSERIAPLARDTTVAAS